MRNTSLVFVVLFAALLMLPGSIYAASYWYVHDFDCDNCHVPGSNINTVANVCLNCHKTTSTVVTIAKKQGPADLTLTSKFFTPGMTSDAFGSRTGKIGAVAPADDFQTSHNWSASDSNPSAGSSSPLDPLFYGRGDSGPNVTCSRCHEPHGLAVAYRTLAANPRLMKLGPGSEDKMCVDCHRNWDTTPSHALGTHPLVDDYPTNFAATAGFQTFAPPTGSNMALGTDPTTSAPNSLICRTCHGVHHTDSNSSTADTPAVGAFGSGDGKLLKATGAQGTSAALRSELCQSCHTYKLHGNTTQIGCLDCHSGHSYNGGTPNYYVLRSDVNTTAFGPKTGLRYTSLPDTVTGGTTPRNQLWAGGVGADGYCEGCHGDVTNNAVGGVSENRVHSPGDDCAQCHMHDDVSSFEAKGCDQCHGYPPVQNVAGGTAVSPTTKGFADNGTYNYSQQPASGKPFYNEQLTKHSLHAAGGTNEYKYWCSACHANNTHNSGQTFQDVFNAPANTLASGNGETTPAYNNAGGCSAVYCHSNGRTRDYVNATSQTVVVAPTPANPSAWENGTNVNGCKGCHGNDKASMTTANNSSAHGKHLDKGYTCDLCHADTAATGSTASLKADARYGDATNANSGKHVNAVVDVVFDGSSFTQFSGTGGVIGTDGTCQNIYCHSGGPNATSSKIPDWDSLTTTCTSCHNNGTDNGVKANAAPNTGAHAKHITDPNGPQISACATCHGHEGALTATNHVNGFLEAPLANCRSCHGAQVGGGGTGFDADPDWYTPGSVSCETCHAGNDIASISTAAVNYTVSASAPVKTKFTTDGHGSVAQFNTNYPTNRCTACHLASDAGHFDGITGDDLRLKDDPNGDTTTNAFGTNASIWCQECHAQNVHYADTFNTAGTSNDGNACAICHEPHGEGMGTNGDAMLIVGSNFADKTLASSYFTVATGANTGTGVCQVCHNPASVQHYNRDTSDGHNANLVCSSCHSHDNNPAFKPKACFECHGDNNADLTANGEYWPQLAGNDRTQTSFAAFNNDGRHQKHMELLASKVYGETATSQATNDITVDNTTANPSLTSDQKQKALCAYCHTVADTDHAGLNNGFADVFPAGGKRIWDGAADADASFDSVNYNCSATDCHNGKDSAQTANSDWYGSATSSCLLCHADIEDTTVGQTGATHSAHLAVVSTGIYAIDITCANCHDSAAAWDSTGSTYAAPANNHINGTLDVVGTKVALGDYTGNYVNATHPVGATYGSCSGNTANACHNDGAGAAPNVAGYAWATAQTETCALCHPASPTNGDHPVHLATGSTNGPKVIGTKCGSCHQSNNNNTTMAGTTTHLNGTVSFLDNAGATNGGPFEITSGNIGLTANDALDVCDTCHGGAANGLLAKDNWGTVNGVSCSSCHTGTASVIGADAAPLKDEYAAVGHGKLPDTASLYDPVACTDCHDAAADHINSGTAPGLNRLKTLSGGSYGTTVTGFCSSCHDSGSGNENVHYANANGTNNSVGGDQCNICHDPHGQKDKNLANLDAMLVNSIGGKDLVGFSSKSARTSYYVASPSTANGYGVCQVCHNPIDSTAGGGAISYFNWTTADTTHNSAGGVCINCHTHTNNPAFKGSCTTCHGAETGANAGQIWPDGTANNSLRVLYADNTTGAHDKHILAITTYLYGVAGNTLAKVRADSGMQVAACAFCHKDPGGTNHDANGGNDSRVDVYQDTDDTTTAADVFKRFALTAATAEKDLSGANADQAYDFATQSCSNLSCHNDTATPTGTSDWGTPPTSPNCTLCHSTNGGTLAHSVHVGTQGYACTQCHVDNGTFPTGTVGVDHINGAVELKWNNGGAFEADFGNSQVGYNGVAAANTQSVGYKAVRNGTCSSAACHTNEVTPGWNAAAATNVCTVCHVNIPTKENHAKHVTTVDTTYGDTGNTTAATYDFGCGNCHTVTASFHRDGYVNLSLDKNDGGTIKAQGSAATQSAGYVQSDSVTYNTSLIGRKLNTTPTGTTTCNAAYCHSALDAAGTTRSYVQTPDWHAGSFTGSDVCAECHANSPVSKAHSVHVAAIHYSDIYNMAGTGLLTDVNSQRNSRHEDVGSVSVINCNVCHNNTVTVWSNSKNTSCATANCHARTLVDVSTTNNVDPNAAVSLAASKASHVNGAADVVFMTMTSFKSRAQVRTFSASQPELNNSWTRSTYKVDAASVDTSKLAADTFGSKAANTCSNIACHNGNDVTWSAPTGNCMTCHNELPE